MVAMRSFGGGESRAEMEMYVEAEVEDQEDALHEPIHLEEVEDHLMGRDTLP